MYALLKENNGELRNNKMNRIVDEVNISDNLIIHSMITQWDDVLCIGIGNLDSKNKELFNLINKFISALNKNDSKKEILEVFNNLEKYVISHFKEEEAIQKERNYPKYAIHNKQHEEFKNRLLDLRNTIETKDISMLFVLKIELSMLKWCRNHIMDFDRHLGAFLIKELRGI